MINGFSAAVAPGFLGGNGFFKATYDPHTRHWSNPFSTALNEVLRACAGEITEGICISMNGSTRAAADIKPGWKQRIGRTFRFLGIITIPMIVASGMLVYGVQGVLLARRFPAAKTLPYAEFARKMPRSGWYRIPDTTIDLSAAVIRHVSSKSTHYRDQVNGYYAPVYGPGGSKDGRCRLLLCVTKDSLPAPQAVTHPIEGLIETDLDKSAPLSRDVSEMGKVLAPDYVVIEDANRPNFGMSLVLALIGIPLTLGNLAAIYAFFFDKSQTADFDDIINGTEKARRRRKTPKAVIK